MQWLAVISAILALLAASYSAGKIQQAVDVGARIHKLEERLGKLENLASRVSMDDRLVEVEKWTRGRCVGISMKKACEEMRVLERPRLMFPDKK